MFDFDAGKLLIIGVLALIVIGPKDLPRVLRQVGQAVGKLRRMAGEFQGQFMDAMKEADIADIRNEMKGLGSAAQLNVNFDPVRDIQTELTQAISPPEAVTTTAEVSHTDGFALPALPATPLDSETASLASAGLAPMTDEAPVEQAAVPEHAVEALSAEPIEFPDGGVNGELRTLKKRKILVPKRRGATPSAIHAVSDRTSLARLRPIRMRRPEVVER